MITRAGGGIQARKSKKVVGWSGIEKFTEAFFDFFMRWPNYDGLVKAYALRGQVGVTFKRFMPKLVKLPRQQNL